MGWPQVVWISLMVIGMTVAAMKHGQPKGNWDFGVSVIDVALYTGILCAGGFFN